MAFTWFRYLEVGKWESRERADGGGSELLCKESAAGSSKWGGCEFGVCVGIAGRVKGQGAVVCQWLYVWEVCAMDREPSCFPW